VSIAPDGKLTDTAVSYRKQPIENGQAVEISAGNMKTFRQLLGLAAKEFPTFDVKEAEKHTKIASAPDDDELIGRFEFSPQAVFGGIVTAAWLYGIHATGHALMNGNQLLEVIKAVQNHGGTFRYMIDGLPGLRGPDVAIGHKLVLRSVPATGKLIAYVEILGVLRVGGVFAATDGPSELIEHIYVYDVTRKEDRSGEFSIDSIEFDRQDWRTVGLGTADSERLRDYFRTATEKTWLPYYRARFDADA
jgi:hypothetical protein